MAENQFLRPEKVFCTHFENKIPAFESKSAFKAVMAGFSGKKPTVFTEFQQFKGKRIIRVVKFIHGKKQCFHQKQDAGNLPNVAWVFENKCDFFKLKFRYLVKLQDKFPENVKPSCFPAKQLQEKMRANCLKKGGAAYLCKLARKKI